MTQPTRFDTLNAFVDVQARTLSPRAQAVWLCLFRRANGNGTSYITRKEITDITGMSLPTVARALSELRKAECIKTNASIGYTLQFTRIICESPGITGDTPCSIYDTPNEQKGNEGVSHVTPQSITGDTGGYHIRHTRVSPVIHNTDYTDLHTDYTDKEAQAPPPVKPKQKRLAGMNAPKNAWQKPEHNFGFWDFWNFYPDSDKMDVKVAPKRAAEIWIELMRQSGDSEGLHKAITTWLERYRTLDKVKRGYVFSPAKFLTERMWETPIQADAVSEALANFDDNAGPGF